jgi:hypothetical protein
VAADLAVMAGPAVVDLVMVADPAVGAETGLMGLVGPAGPEAVVDLTGPEVDPAAAAEQAAATADPALDPASGWETAAGRDRIPVPRR